MPLSLPLTRRRLLGSTLATPFVLRASSGLAATTKVKFSLAAPLDGSTAPFFLAQSKGWYTAAGFNCQFDSSGGSGEAISRVGSGVYEYGIGDINVMMEFNAKNPASAVRDIYMLYYRSPLCVCSLKKSGIKSPKDLESRKLGAAAADGAYRLFPAFSKVTGIDPSKIQWDMVGLQLREAVLARGDVDAILGFDSTMYFGLVAAGIDPDDIEFIYYSDVGMPFYGNGIIASEQTLSGDPDRNPSPIRLRQSRRSIPATL
jgi:NitT/TauT family transport system substrate-binding protein